MNSQKRFQSIALSLMLSASTMLAATSIKGACDGKETDTLDGPRLLVNGSGVGTALNIGRFTYTWKVTVDLVTGLSTGGEFALTAVAGGDTLTGAFVGSGQPTDTTNVAQIVELISITGGTGRFKGATGRLTMKRLLDQALGLTSGTLTGAITLP